VLWRSWRSRKLAVVMHRMLADGEPFNATAKAMMRSAAMAKTETMAAAAA